MKKAHYCPNCKEPESYCLCQQEYKCPRCGDTYYSEESIRETDGVCWNCIEEEKLEA